MPEDSRLRYADARCDGRRADSLGPSLVDKVEGDFDDLLFAGGRYGHHGTLKWAHEVYGFVCYNKLTCMNDQRRIILSLAACQALLLTNNIVNIAMKRAGRF
jgi:hypothetical protein